MISIMNAIINVAHGCGWCVMIGRGVGPKVNHVTKTIRYAKSDLFSINFIPTYYVTV